MKGGNEIQKPLTLEEVKKRDVLFIESRYPFKEHIFGHSIGDGFLECIQIEEVWSSDILFWRFGESFCQWISKYQLNRSFRFWRTRPTEEELNESEWKEDFLKSDELVRILEEDKSIRAAQCGVWMNINGVNIHLSDYEFSQMKRGKESLK